jgi:hypothetical protein
MRRTCIRLSILMSTLLGILPLGAAPLVPAVQTIDLGTLGGKLGSTGVSAINDSGLIAGSAQFLSGETRAVLWKTR